MGFAIRTENLGRRYRLTDRRREFRDLFGRRRESVFDPGDVWALRGLDLTVEPGEAVGIVGGNGAGKSTLLKILSRIVAPTEGIAETRGRLSALLEVGAGFHPELSGRENVMLSGALLGMSRAETSRKFAEILEFSEIGRFVDSPVKYYSSGMYVRLAFAVAAHLNPDILLLDEVLAVGDARFQRKCLGKLREMKDRGTTMLFVSHNMASVSEFCQRVVWIDGGKKASDGNPDAVIREYLLEKAVPVGQAHFVPPLGSHHVRVHRVEICDAAGGVRPRLRPGERIDVHVWYDVSAPIDGARVGFRLYNDRGTPILQTATSDSLESIGNPGSVGDRHARVSLPGNWLSPGRYSLEVGFWSPGIGHHVHVFDAVAFDIQDDVRRQGASEILRPILGWEVA